MPLMLEPHDYLSYIDPSPTDAQRAAAISLLESSLPNDHTTTLHPSIATSYKPCFSPLILTAHASIAETGTSRTPGSGIDLSRYEEPTPPTTSDEGEWHTTLRNAYVSAEYLVQRHFNLSLLERFGKNAWLIGNSQAEDELRRLERELGEVKRQIEEVEEGRRRLQEGVAGELQGLEEAWRTGIGNAIEAEVAGYRVEREIQRRREK